ncbi:MAG: FAD-binding protein [Thermoleophilia bacterium]
MSDDLDEPYGTPRLYRAVERGRTLLAALAPLWQAAVDEGAIQPLLRRRAIDLVVEGGAVVGVRVERTDGLVGELRARSIVLATGGYGARRELHAELGRRAAPRLGRPAGVDRRRDRARPPRRRRDPRHGRHARRRGRDRAGAALGAL